MTLTKLKFLVIVTSLIYTSFLISCGRIDEEEMDEMEEEEIVEPPNILLIIADDMGLDATNGFSEGITKPMTPHLDSLLNTGIKFTNLWVNPTCSPTRASIITGKYGSSSNVLEVGDVLSNDEQILQAYINEQTNDQYATAVIGKWHLASSNTFNPETFGLDYYAGILSGGVPNYTSWTLSEDGNNTVESAYVSEKLSDLSIDWVADQEKPWFLWLAFNAPHTPFHLPPNEMHSQGALPSDQASIDANPLPYYLAAIEAMDYQIGRLLDSLEPEEKENTIIFFIGDNGTPNAVVQSPFSRRRAKGSLYQGGVNVPMFVTGKSINRTGTDESLINGTDLYATIASVAGVSVESINDSKNFKPLLTSASTTHRDLAFTETIDSWVIRNDQYKLHVDENGNQEFYDLLADPYEAVNLLQDNNLSDQQEATRASLEVAANAIRQ